MYKTETHLHVSEVSACARLTAMEMIECYAEAGYHTVFVSDHFVKSYFDRMPSNTWEENVDWFLGGYQAAKKAGDTLGITVLLAVEMQMTCSPYHYLSYGITREFLLNAPHIYDMSLEEYYAYAKTNGVFVIQAHPTRDGKHQPTPECVDGFEAPNTNPRHFNFDDQVIELARQTGKLITSGSDAHRIEDVGHGGIATEQPILSAEDYKNALQSGAYQRLGGDCV